MVVKAGGYFGPPFKEYRGVTQGDPLSPKIFNVVVDAVIRHWVTVVALAEAGVEVLRDTIQELADFFYADDALVASLPPEKFQRAFNVLADLFDQFGLHTNVHKTVSMDCRPC